MIFEKSITICLPEVLLLKWIDSIGEGVCVAD